MSLSDITSAFSAVVGLEPALSRRCVSRDTCAVVAALCVRTVAPVAADISHVLALVVICRGRKVGKLQTGGKIKKEKKKKLQMNLKHEKWSVFLHCPALVYIYFPQDMFVIVVHFFSSTFTL